MCRSQQDAGNRTLIYSGNEINIFGTGSMINRKYKQAVMNLGQWMTEYAPCE